MAIIIYCLISAFCFTMAALISLLKMDILTLVLYSSAALVMAFIASLDIRDYIIKKNRLTFADLLAACKQTRVNPDFNDNNFSPKPIASDESEYEVYEYHFDETVNGMDAFRKLEELGYRLCGPCRAMEYIANGHLNDQLDHPLIITARWQDPYGYWYAPVFSGYCGERGMGLYDLVCGFDPHYGWLVLRKKQSI